jgi:dienelactone hydrolase
LKTQKNARGTDWLKTFQEPPARVPPSSAPPPRILFDDHHQPIEIRDSWMRRKSDIQKRWRAFLGEIALPRSAPELRVLEEDRPDDGAILRQRVRYESEPGVPVEAYLLRPGRASPERRPSIAVFHSTVDHTIRQPAGLEGSGDLHIGLHLARRGYVALCPENFLWAQRGPGRLEDAVGWLHRRHPDVTGMAKMLFDSQRAVDVLAAQTDVDPDRIGAIGHSLGAKEVLYLAAFDQRVRATVSSEGGIGIDSSNWNAPWYLGEAAGRPGFGLHHAELLALVAPRAFLLVAGESADGDRSWPYLEANLPVWRLTDAPGALGWINHRAGHAFPPSEADRAYQWLDHFLKGV